MVEGLRDDAPRAEPVLLCVLAAGMKSLAELAQKVVVSRAEPQL